LPHYQILDLGRSHRLCPQQEPGYCLDVGGGSCTLKSWATAFKVVAPGLGHLPL